MSKRAVLYARVSTDEQAKEDKTSIQAQIDECRKYAERIGYPVVAEHREDYTGTITMAERPVGKLLAEILQRHEADAVIARRVNRLSRDVIDLMVTARQWLRSGIEIHIAQHGRKIEREDDIVFMLEGWQGTNERRDIVERGTEGLYNKAKAGRVVGIGNTPYGYRYANGCFIIVEEEAKIVRLIYTWYVHGDERGELLTQFAIARRLSEMHVPTPMDNGRKGGRKHDEGIWNYGTVGNILQAETYYGIWRFGKTKSAPKQGPKTRIHHPEQKQVVVSVPAIIDRNLWEQAQVQRGRNSRMAKRNCKREYLLRGMIRCGCGGAMVGDTSRGKYSYYVCITHYRRYSGVEPVRCPEKPVRCDAAEEIVWEYVYGLIRDPERFERALRQAQQREIDTLAPKRERLETVLGLISDYDKEATNYAQEIGKAGEAMRRALEAQIADLEKRYAALIIERDQLQTQLDMQRLTEEALRAALRFREDVVAGIEGATFANKRRVLELLQVQVTVRNREIQTNCLIPMCANEETAARWLSTRTPRNFSRVVPR